VEAVPVSTRSRQLIFVRMRTTSFSSVISMARGPSIQIIFRSVPPTSRSKKSLNVPAAAFPKLARAEVMRGVTGVYDMTPDSRPLLGQIAGIDGLYVCAGFSGMGFKISPAIGLVMSELVVDGKAKTVDISAFRPERFVDNQPIKAEFEYVDD
jgi:glycine/D-amino acid oxidase-like deaminating enzyme